LAAVFMLAACGSAKRAAATHSVTGAGFSAEVPAAWRVSRSPNGIVARRGGLLVSVTVFPLRRPYRPSQFDAAATELDRVAAQLAAQAGVTVSERITTTVADRRIRAYRYAHTRLGFVLVDKREYQLLCVGQSDACALLFSSFTVS
jgi:ABC-type transport system involved in cytochrome c biogenesis permease component